MAAAASAGTTPFSSLQFRPPISFQLPAGLTVRADEPGIVFIDGGSPQHGASTEANIMRVCRVWNART